MFIYKITFNIFNLKDAITCGIKALQIAASNDSATVGPSIENNIFPTIYVCTSEDLMELSNEEIKELYERFEMNTFYVSPNQVIKDKTEFAKIGIEKGRTTVSAENHRRFIVCC